VEIGKGTSIDEAQSGRVIRSGFAGKAGDDVGTDRGVREPVADEFNATGIVFGAVPAVHGGEDTVGSRLQRHVEMRSDAIGGSKEIDEVGGNVEGLDGADAESLHGGFIEDAAEKIEECDAGGKVAAVGAEIDAAENDFAKAGFGETLNLGDNGEWRKATRFAANKRNDAKRAARITAILNFEGWASVIPFSTKNRGNEHIGKLRNVARENGSAVVRNRVDGDSNVGGWRGLQDW